LSTARKGGYNISFDTTLKSGSKGSVAPAGGGGGGGGGGGEKKQRRMEQLK